MFLGDLIKMIIIERLYMKRIFWLGKGKSLREGKKQFSQKKLRFDHGLKNEKSHLIISKGLSIPYIPIVLPTSFGKFLFFMPSF